LHSLVLNKVAAHPFRAAMLAFPGLNDGVSEAFLNRIAYPAVIMAGLALHAYTGVMAYALAGQSPLKYAVALAAWALPGIAQLVVSYYAWQQSGSVVNSYSIWVLAWLVLCFGVTLFARVIRGRARAKRQRIN
jgi:uncharacterized membrane protein